MYKEFTIIACAIVCGIASPVPKFSGDMMNEGPKWFEQMASAFNQDMKTPFGGGPFTGPQDQAPEDIQKNLASDSDTKHVGEAKEVPESAFWAGPDTTDPKAQPQQTAAQGPQDQPGPDPAQQNPAPNEQQTPFYQNTAFLQSQLNSQLSFINNILRNFLTF